MVFWFAVLTPVALLALGSRARRPGVGRVLVAVALTWFACLAVFAILALPIGGSVEGGEVDGGPPVAAE